MNRHNEERRLLLEMFADGELQGDERAEVERWIEEDPASAAWVEHTRSLREILRTPICLASESVDFDALHARLDRLLDDEALAGSVASARDAELEMHAMALADGELDDPELEQLVRSYLAEHADAQDAFLGLAELREIVRIPIEQATERADFRGLSARLDAQIDALAEPAPAPASTSRATPGFFTQLAAFFGAHRAVTASALTAAVTAGVLFLVIGPGGPTDPAAAPTELAQQPTVINNYYIASPVVDSMEYENGFWGSVSPGDEDQGIAPVVWIEAEPPASEDNPPL